MNKQELKQVNKIVLDHINDMENNAEKENPVYVKEKKDFDGKYKAIEEELRTMLKDWLKMKEIKVVF